MDNLSNKKILILGSNYQSGVSQYLHRNLRKMNFDSEHMNAIPSQHNIVKIKYTGKIKKAFGQFLLNYTIERKVKKEKLGLVISLMPYYIDTRTWQAMQNKKIPIVGWILNNPRRKYALLNPVKYYTITLIADQQWRGYILKKNPRATTYFLPAAADPDISFKISREKIPNYKNYECDVVFAGSPFSEEKGWNSRYKVLQALYDAGFNVKLYGDNSWLTLAQQHPFITKIFQNRPVEKKELNLIYNASKIALNIHSNQLETGTNQRIFEATASGAFVLSDYRETVKKIYGENIALFKTIDELKEKTRYYLGHNDEREALAKTARNITVSHHTYKKRIETILSLLG